jgi:hypothetical protein
MNVQLRLLAGLVALALGSVAVVVAVRLVHSVVG